MVGYSTEIDRIFIFILYYFAFLLVTAYLGQWMTFVSPSIQISLMGTLSFLLLMNCINGFFIPNKDLMKIFQIINYINPINFFYSTVSTTQLHCNEGDICDMISLPSGIVYYKYIIEYSNK